jgi:hypothetical protein
MSRAISRLPRSARADRCNGESRSATPSTSLTGLLLHPSSQGPPDRAHHGCDGTRGVQAGRGRPCGVEAAGLIADVRQEATFAKARIGCLDPVRQALWPRWAAEDFARLRLG